MMAEFRLSSVAMLKAVLGGVLLAAVFLLVLTAVSHQIGFGLVLIGGAALFGAFVIAVLVSAWRQRNAR